MDIKNFFASNILKMIIWIIGGLIVFCLIFSAGMMVGFRKADFSYRWGDNYHMNFAGPRGGFMDNFNRRDFMDAHGTFGQIIKIDGATLIIKGQDNVEKIVLVNDKTAVNSMMSTIKVSDLKVDDFIVVIGEPNNSGQIEARFIRVMPAPPTDGSMPMMSR